MPLMMQAAMEAVQQEAMALGQAVYGQQQAGGAAPGGEQQQQQGQKPGGDDVSAALRCAALCAPWLGRRGGLCEGVRVDVCVCVCCASALLGDCMGAKLIQSLVPLEGWVGPSPLRYAAQCCGPDLAACVPPLPQVIDAEFTDKQ